MSKGPEGEQPFAPVIGPAIIDQERALPRPFPRDQFGGCPDTARAASGI